MEQVGLKIGCKVQNTPDRDINAVCLGVYGAVHPFEGERFEKSAIHGVCNRGTSNPSPVNSH